MEEKIIKIIFVTFGSLFLFLGVIGIIIPILPTTPFLLLAAACYARGSQRFYDWLITNKWFGKYIKNYREGRGIPMSVKIISIVLLWVTISFSIIIIALHVYFKSILLLIAIAVSIHILSIKTLEHRE